MVSPERIQSHILENYGSGIADEETIEAITEVVRIVSQERARKLRHDDEPTEDDIEWTLGWFCWLPLWPKPDDEEPETQKVRQAMLNTVSDDGGLPALPTIGIFNLNHPTLLHLRVGFSEGEENTSLRNMIAHQGAEEVSKRIRQEAL